MNEEWWERPAAILNDLWWLWLIIIVLGITAFFTRNTWLPIVGLESSGSEPIAIATMTKSTIAPGEVIPTMTARPTDAPKPTKTNKPTEKPAVTEGVVGTGVEINHKAPDFSLATLDGKNVSLSDSKGSPTIVTFFASWCEYCEDQAEVLKVVYDEKHPDGLEIIAVNITNDDDISDVKSYVDKYGWEFDTLLDEEGEVSQEYNPGGSTPMTLFIDSKGIIQYIQIGFLEQDGFDDKVEMILDS